MKKIVARGANLFHEAEAELLSLSLYADSLVLAPNTLRRGVAWRGVAWRHLAALDEALLRDILLDDPRPGWPNPHAIAQLARSLANA